jgi:hypothetical protein
MKKVVYLLLIVAVGLTMSCKKQGSAVDGKWTVAGVELQNWTEYFDLYKTTTKASLEATLAQDSSLMVNEKMKKKEKDAVEAAKTLAVAKLDSTVAALDANAEAMKADYSKMMESMVFTFNADGTYSISNGDAVAEEGTFTVSEDKKSLNTMTKDSVQVVYPMELVNDTLTIFVDKAIAKEGQAEALNTFVHKAKLTLAIAKAE